METNRRHGLCETEARERLVRFSPNRPPPARKRSLLLRFLSQFNKLLIILLAAASVTFLPWNYVDTAVIVAVSAFNAFTGFIQEGKAEAADIEAVRNPLSPSAAVLRGAWETVPAEQLCSSCPSIEAKTE